MGAGCVSANLYSRFSSQQPEAMPEMPLFGDAPHFFIPLGDHRPDPTGQKYASEGPVRRAMTRVSEAYDDTVFIIELILGLGAQQLTGKYMKLLE